MLLRLTRQETREHFDSTAPPHPLPWSTKGERTGKAQGRRRGLADEWELVPIRKGTRMLHAILALIFLAAPAPAASAPGVAEATSPPAAATTRPVVMSATQPVAVAVITAEQLADAQNQTITEVFSKTRMGELFQG